MSGKKTDCQNSVKNEDKGIDLFLGRIVFDHMELLEALMLLNDVFTVQI